MMFPKTSLKYPIFLKKELVNYSPYKRSLEMAMLFNVEISQWKPWALQYDNWFKNLDRNGALELVASLSEMAVRFIEDFDKLHFSLPSVSAKPDGVKRAVFNLPVIGTRVSSPSELGAGPPILHNTLEQEKIFRAVRTVASVLHFVSVNYADESGPLDINVGQFYFFLDTLCQTDLMPYFSTHVVHGMDLFSVNVRNSQSLDLFCRCVSRSAGPNPVPFSLAKVDTPRAVSKLTEFPTLFLQGTMNRCSNAFSVHPQATHVLREWGLFSSTVSKSFFMMAWDRKGMDSELFYADVRKTCLWKWADGFLASQCDSRTGVLLSQVLKFIKTLRAAKEVSDEVWTYFAAVFFDPMMWQQYFFSDEVCLTFYLGLVECWDWVRPVLEAHVLLPRGHPEEQAQVLAQLSPLGEHIRSLTTRFFEVSPGTFEVQADLAELKISLLVPKNRISEFVSKNSDGFVLWQVRNFMGPRMSRKKTLTTVVHLAKGVLNVQSCYPAFAPRVLAYPVRNTSMSFSERTQAAIVGLQAMLSFKQQNPWFLQKSSHVFFSELQRTSIELFEFLVEAAKFSRRHEHPTLSKAQQQEVISVSTEGMLPMYFMKRAFIRRIPPQTRILIDKLRSGLPLRTLPIYHACLPVEEPLFLVSDIVENIFSFIDIGEIDFIDLLIWSFLPDIPYPPNLRFGS